MLIFLIILSPGIFLQTQTFGAMLKLEKSNMGKEKASVLSEAAWGVRLFERNRKSFLTRLWIQNTSEKSIRHIQHSYLFVLLPLLFIYFLFAFSFLYFLKKRFLTLCRWSPLLMKKPTQKKLWCGRWYDERASCHSNPCLLLTELGKCLL